MWQLSNTTPFAARVTPYRDHTGASFWGVWIKAGFALREGRPPLFVRDGAVLNEGPVWRDGAPENGLLADSDLLQPKPLVDLVVIASAVPNEDRTARTIALAVGDWRKELVLHPPRRPNWRGVLVADREAKLAPVPLDARATFGGPDYPGNPLGTGAAEESPPPQVTTPDDPKGTRPAWFGPIPSIWPQRVALGGTYDARWMASRAPLLPADFDPAFWQSAPEDQRLPRELPEDAALVVTGLAPKPQRYPLPLLDLQTATRIAGRWQQAVPELQTIHVDLLTGHVTVTYLARWPIASAAEDVNIETTTVRLESSASFRVTPEDAPLFAGRAVASEAAS